MRTSFLGRETELGLIADAMSDALDGRPRVVLCSGEPGIGKTRLAEEVCPWLEAGGGRDQLPPERGRVAGGAVSAHEQHDGDDERSHCRPRDAECESRSQSGAPAGCRRSSAQVMKRL